MKFVLALSVMSSLMLSACTADQKPSVEVKAADYAVTDAASLQHKIDALNAQLASDYQQLKQQQHIAFSDQSPLDVMNLNSLHLHAVSATSLKPVKEEYCQLMNSYFNTLYRMGHFNLKLLDQIQLKHQSQTALAPHFANADAFYEFALSDYSSYKQAQQIMGFGCNLRAALSPNT